MRLLENITDISYTSTSEEFRQEKVLTSLELFAGAGGLALGVHAAGFKHLALIERDTFAAETLRENSQRLLNLDPGRILNVDARSVDYGQFASKVDLLTGGPPCQPFSTGGRNRGHTDTRDTFPIFLDAVGIIMPRTILIENVKGLLRKKFQDYFTYILKRLRFPLHQRKEGEDWYAHYSRLLKVTEADFADDEQYTVSYQLVDTADYGIPQRRLRVLISAFRRDLGIETFHLTPTHSKEALLVDQWITGAYWERHGIPPNDILGPMDKKILDRLQSSLFSSDGKQPWKTVRDALCDLPKPVLRGQKEEIPNHVQHPGARIYSGHIGSYWDYPAKALKAGTHGTPGGENVLCESVNDSVRYFTTREAARLQTFPDEWRFHGTWGACIKQLGNAVPVELATRISLEVCQRLLTHQLWNKNANPLEERNALGELSLLFLEETGSPPGFAIP